MNASQTLINHIKRSESLLLTAIVWVEKIKK